MNTPFRKHLSVILMSAATLLLYSSSAYSAVLYDNGSYSGGQSNTANTAGGQELFDDFSLSGDSIVTGFTWQQYDQDFNYQGTRVSIYDGNPETATLIYTADIIATKTYNPGIPVLFSNAGGDFIAYDYSIDGLGINLDAGSYWLGLNTIENSGTRSGFINTTGTAATVPGFWLHNANFPGGTDWSGNLAFQVHGRAADVPEPATLALLGLGLAGIGFSRKAKTL